MEKLTNKNPCDNCTSIEQIGNPYYWQCECDKCSKYPEWKNKCIEKLKDYEDLQEQGLLLKLPCRVGDIVYAIELDEEKFDSFRCPLRIAEYKFELGMYALVGKCVFVTQAEAEEKLKKIESEG